MSELLNKYNQAFVDVFAVDPNVLGETFTKDNVDSWDSVHQLNIVAILEESFDVMFEPEDIMELISYEKGKELLKKYDVKL